MQSRRLFALLWRINALVILIVGLLAAVVLSLLAYFFAGELTSTRRAHNVSNVAEEEVSQQLTELDEFEAVEGTDLLRARQRVQQTYRRGSIGSGSKEAWSTRNYLYLDPNTRSSHWLVPGMDGLFLDSYALPRGDCERQRGKARLFIHVSVNRDTDGDQRLSESDRQAIAISDPDGRNYRLVVAQADKLQTAQLLEGDRLLIVYSDGGKLMAAELPMSQSKAAQVYEIKPQTKPPAAASSSASQP